MGDTYIINRRHSATGIVGNSYENLSDKPKINNVELSGNKTADDLSLVKSEQGKGLSKNDFTDEYKTNIEQNTSKINQSIEPITAVQLADTTNLDLIFPGFYKYNGNFSTWSSSLPFSTVLIPCLANDVLSGRLKNTELEIAFFDSSKNFISGLFYRGGKILVPNNPDIAYCGIPIRMESQYFLHVAKNVELIPRNLPFTKVGDKFTLQGYSDEFPKEQGIYNILQFFDVSNSRVDLSSSLNLGNAWRINFKFSGTGWDMIKINATKFIGTWGAGPSIVIGKNATNMLCLSMAAATKKLTIQIRPFNNQSYKVFGEYEIPEIICEKYRSMYFNYFLDGQNFTIKDAVNNTGFEFNFTIPDEYEPCFGLSFTSSGTNSDAFVILPQYTMPTYNNTKDTWQNKKWYCYGTSMTEYLPNEGKTTGQYAKWLERFSGMKMYNYGKGGSGIIPSLHGGTTADHVKSRVMRTSDGKINADLITLEVIPNDMSGTLGELTDISDDTFLGNLGQCLQYLLENTTAQIIVLIATPSRYQYQHPENLYTPESEYRVKWQTWAEATRKKCSLYGVTCIDGSECATLGYYRVSKDNKYVADQIHLTSLGGYNLAKYYWNALEKISPFISDF